MPNWVKNIVRTSEETMIKIKEKYSTNGTLDFNKIIPMPKSLELTEGSITENAIFYAFIKKNDEQKKEIVKILKSTNEIFYENYWDKLMQYYKEGHFKDIENQASEYIPDKTEKELNIKTLEELGDTYISNIKNYGSITWYDWSVQHWGTKWGASRCQSNDNTIIFETAWSTPEPIFKKLSKEFPNEIIKVEYADECCSNENNGQLFFQNGVCFNSIELGEKFAIKVWSEQIENQETQKDITDDLF